MSKRSIVITAENGTYQIHNSILNEFELLGLFEQIVFDLKYSKQAGKSPGGNKSEVRPAPVAEAEQPANVAMAEREELPTSVEQSDETTEPKASAPRIAGVTSSAATDLRTRIGNAVKAIRKLGGRIESADLSKMSDDDLQTELEELTAQYKRLKSSKGSK